MPSCGMHKQRHLEKHNNKIIVSQSLGAQSVENFSVTLRLSAKCAKIKGNY